MNETYIKNVVEAALLAAGRPLTLNELTQLFDESARPDAAGLRAALDSLEADYTSRGIEVKETANGFRIQVRREMANEVSRLWPERPPRYSRALLETLALIAYRQPITRAEIEAVRGVAVNPNIIKTVIERNWVRVVGTRDVPGRPELLGTTKEFLDYFGLRSLEELPPLAELKAMGEINLQLDLAKPGDTPGGEGGGGEGGDQGGEGQGGASVPSAANAAGAAAVSAAGAIGAVAAAANADDAAAGESPAEGSDAVQASDAVDADADAAEITVEAITLEGEAAEAEVLTGIAVDELAEADDAAAEAIELSEADEAVAEAIELVDADEAIGETVDLTGAEEPAAEPIALTGDVDGDSEGADAVATAAQPVESASVDADAEADSGDVTVEVETLGLVEARIEAFIEPDESAEAPGGEPGDVAIETGQFELTELGMGPAGDLIEAEFEAEELDTAESETESEDEEAADDEEELSAGPQSSTELVAAPRGHDD